MKTYTVADLRKNTRQILNEAATEPVAITRYDETFVLVKQGELPAGAEMHKLDDSRVNVPKIIKNPSDIPAGVAVPGACVHGAAKGFCKVAKCPNSKR